MHSRTTNVYAWPSHDRNPISLATRVQIWFDDCDLFFRLPQNVREGLLYSAREVFEGFTAEQKVHADVDDADSRLEALELQFGERCVQPWDRRVGLSEQQLDAITVTPWIRAEVERLARMHERDIPNGGHRRLSTTKERTTAMDGSEADGRRSCKRRKVIVDGDGDESVATLGRGLTPEIVVSSPEGSPEPCSSRRTLPKLDGRRVESKYGKMGADG